MSKVDIFLLIVLLMGAWSGYREGFLMEIFSLAAIILGVLGGFKLMGVGMLYLQREFNADKSTLPYLSFIIIFLLIVILVRVIGKMLRYSIDKTFLGKMDQLLGAVLGLLKTTFIFSVVIWIVDSLKITFPESWIVDSWLLPIVAKTAPTLSAWIGQFFPFFKEIFQTG